MSSVNDSLAAAGRKSSGKRSLLERFFTSVRGADFAVRFWDGTGMRFGAGDPEFEIFFRREPGLVGMASSPSLFFGEGYMRGDIDMTGSYKAMARALGSVTAMSGGESFSGRILSAVSGLSGTIRSLAEQKSDVAAHYDLGNDFFSLWLDGRTQSYSCAYFRTESDSLETAQQQKIDLVLRKLCVRPGMRLLDIGCGWGGLSLSAALDHGAKVLAITLSEEQASTVRKRFEEHGLDGLCEVRLCNYLELGPEEKFDRISSVGMFEHVGKAHYGNYFEKIRTLLNDGGLSLLHTLTKNKPAETDPWIAKYIFPGGHIPALSEIVTELAERDLRLLHTESLRRHYVRTLDIWSANFNRPDVLEKVRAMFDREFVRMWSLYLDMASAFLAIGGLDVNQLVFSKGTADDLPMTLESVYNWG